MTAHGKIEGAIGKPRHLCEHFTVAVYLSDNLTYGFSVAIRYLVPMNMDEWQRRLKADKEAERKKKMESSEMLKGYRGSGLAEEDKKLMQMRQEDRKKHLLAEQMLHEYRKTDEPGAKKRPERQQAQHPPGVERAADPLGYISPGSVSARAANFVGTPPRGQASTEASRVGAALPPPNISEAMDDSPPHDSRNLPVDATPVLATAGSMEEKKLDTLDQKPVDSMVAEEEIVVEESFADPVAPPEMTSQAATSINQEIRLDIHISFGLVSATLTPDYASYMSAIEEVVKAMLNQGGPLTGVVYKPECAPYVTNEEWDGECSTNCSRFADGVAQLRSLRYISLAFYRYFLFVAHVFP